MNMSRRFASAICAALVLCSCSGNPSAANSTPPTTMPTAAAQSTTLLATAVPSAPTITPGEPTIRDAQPDVPTATPDGPIIRDAQSILPAPVYFLTSARQIGRLEVDGKSYQIITNEPFGIAEYSVSPKDGAILFVPRSDADSIHGDRLVQVDAFGQNRIEREKGAISNVQWSPSGDAFALSWRDGPQADAIYWGTTDGAISIVAHNSPATPEDPGQLYGLIGWSPDGSKLLLTIGANRGPDQAAGDVFGIRVADRRGKLSEIIPPSGEAGNCGQPIWASDSQSVYCARRTNDATLWRIPIASKTPEVLVQPDQGIDFMAMQPLANNTFHALVSQTTANGATILSMEQRDADGNKLHELRPDTKSG